MQSAGYVMACCAFLVTFMSNPVSAAPTTQPSEDFRKIESATVTVGDILTRIDGPKMWTMSGIDWQGTVMAVEDSAYGTVITIRGAGHLGTAHFLDVPGKPGEIEKENVADLKLYVDDEPVTSLAPRMSLSGKSFRMERRSNIRALHLESSVDIRDGVLVETAHLTTTEPMDLQMSYPLMYAWTPKATKYLFGDDSGIQKRGTFLGDDAKPTEGREMSSRWMAVFEPQSGKGAVCYVVQHPATADAWLQYTDAPKIYRKLRIMSFVDSIVPAGFDGTFQSILGFFTATEPDWEAKAQKCVADLKIRAARLEKP